MKSDLCIEKLSERFKTHFPSQDLMLLTVLQSSQPNCFNGTIIRVSTNPIADVSNPITEITRFLRSLPLIEELLNAEPSKRITIDLILSLLNPLGYGNPKHVMNLEYCARDMSILTVSTLLQKLGIHLAYGHKCTDFDIVAVEKLGLKWTKEFPGFWGYMEGQQPTFYCPACLVHPPKLECPLRNGTNILHTHNEPPVLYDPELKNVGKSQVEQILITKNVIVPSNWIDIDKLPEIRELSQLEITTIMKTQWKPTICNTKPFGLLSFKGFKKIEQSSVERLSLKHEISNFIVWDTDRCKYVAKSGSIGKLIDFHRFDFFFIINFLFFLTIQNKKSRKSIRLFSYCWKTRIVWKMFLMNRY